jgi:hypothetical protein
VVHSLGTLAGDLEACGCSHRAVGRSDLRVVTLFMVVLVWLPSGGGSSHFASPSAPSLHGGRGPWWWWACRSTTMLVSSVSPGGTLVIQIVDSGTPCVIPSMEASSRSFLPPMLVLSTTWAAPRETLDLGLLYQMRRCVARFLFLGESF